MSHKISVKGQQRDGQKKDRWTTQKHDVSPAYCCQWRHKNIDMRKVNKMLSYRRETALQRTLVLAERGRLELAVRFNVFPTYTSYTQYKIQ